MKVDVVISAYGKPWQTLCTLKSLMKVRNLSLNAINVKKNALSLKNRQYR